MLPKIVEKIIPTPPMQFVVFLEVPDWKGKCMVDAHQSWSVFFHELVHQPLGNFPAGPTTQGVLLRKDFLGRGVTVGTIDGQFLDLVIGVPAPE